MRAIIAMASPLTLALLLQCWSNCECEVICPVAGVFACAGLVLLAGAAIYIVTGIVWELHLLSR